MEQTGEWLTKFKSGHYPPAVSPACRNENPAADPQTHADPFLGGTLTRKKSAKIYVKTRPAYGLHYSFEISPIPRKPLSALRPTRVLFNPRSSNADPNVLILIGSSALSKHQD